MANRTDGLASLDEAATMFMCVFLDDFSYC